MCVNVHVRCVQPGCRLFVHMYAYECAHTHSHLHIHICTHSSHIHTYSLTDLVKTTKRSFHSILSLTTNFSNLSSFNLTSAQIEGRVLWSHGACMSIFAQHGFCTALLHHENLRSYVHMRLELYHSACSCVCGSIIVRVKKAGQFGCTVVQIGWQQE